MPSSRVTARTACKRAYVLHCCILPLQPSSPSSLCLQPSSSCLACRSGARSMVGRHACRTRGLASGARSARRQSRRQWLHRVCAPQSAEKDGVQRWLARRWDVADPFERTLVHLIRPTFLLAERRASGNAWGAVGQLLMSGGAHCIATHRAEGASPPARRARIARMYVCYL